MADGEEASVTPPTPPNPQVGDPTFDIAQIGHQNALMLQQMAGMIQNAMTQSRLENEQAMTQTRLELEQLVNDKFASGSGEGPKNPHVTTGDGEDHTENRNPPPRTEKVASYKTFRASGTIEFFGDMDPVKAYDWIRTTEKAFRLSHTAEVDKVNFASGMLKKSALEWWDSIEGSTGDVQAQGFTWDAFKERFLRKYCPTDLQDRYAKEFIELKQGKMDVTTYLAEFNLKSKFAAEMVPTEARKIKRFVDGLRIEIREKLDGNVFANLDEAAEMARRREHILTIRDTELMPAPKKPRFDNSFGRSFSPNQSRSRFQPGSQARIVLIN